MTPKKFTNDEFIKRATKKHGDRYDYSLVEYTGSTDKIKIICPYHGVFEQTPANHLSGKGCNKCAVRSKAGKRRLSLHEFFVKAREVHGDTYNYSDVDVIDANHKVAIICRVHGVFYQTPSKHFSGQGCRSCSYNQRASDRRYSKGWFVKKAKEIHGDNYDYSQSVYDGVNNKITIICPDHGAWLTTPDNHIYIKQGCPACNESRGEKEIALWLDRKGVKYERQKRFRECRNINPLPFDFYLADFNMLIEYDGAQHDAPGRGYFAKSFEAIQRNDRIKTEWATTNGYLFIRIKHYQNVSEALDSLFRTLER